MGNPVVRNDMILRYNRFLVFLLVVCCLVNGVCASAQQHSYGRSAPSEKASEPDTSSRRGISLRTNLVYAASATPNIGLEIPVGKHVSLGLNAGLKPWPRWLAWDWDKTLERKWRHFLIAPEFRFWPSGVYEKLFVGADLIYTHFNVGAVQFPFGMYPGVRDHRLQGDLYGLGVFAGWSWWLSAHWRLEAEAGVGAGYADALKYQCAYCGAEVGRQQGFVLVPKLGLNLSYNFLRRKR